MNTFSKNIASKPTNKLRGKFTKYRSCDVCGAIGPAQLWMNVVLVTVPALDKRFKPDTAIGRNNCGMDYFLRGICSKCITCIEVVI